MQQQVGKGTGYSSVNDGCWIRRATLYPAPIGQQVVAYSDCLAKARSPQSFAMQFGGASISHADMQTPCSISSV